MEKGGGEASLVQACKKRALIITDIQVLLNFKYVHSLPSVPTYGGGAKGALIMKMGGGGQFFGSNTNLIIGKKIKPIAPCYRRFVTGIGISNNQ